MNEVASLILPPLSVLYEGIVRARTAFYRSGYLPTAELSAPVISVGNITTGGTGKTPLVEWLARLLVREGRRVCVLTRGYGRENAASQIIVSDGENVVASAAQAGDEPFLLAKNLKGLASVISNADRTSAGRWAKRYLGADTFVLDDGFQHLRLQRDFDLITIDATNPWGGGRLLPCGRLREPLLSLRRANAIVLTRLEQVGDAREIIRRLDELSDSRPVFRSEMRMRSLTELTTGKILSSSNTSEHRVIAFCGVGNPTAFFNGLCRQGFELALTRAFPDHHAYQQSDVDLIVSEAKSLGVPALLTTSKDAVKLSSISFDLPCYVFDIEIAIANEAELQEMIRAALTPRL
jgi:tetraacyldisaccharide 4'-kinase